MKTPLKPITNVTEYIADQEPAARKQLKQIREAIRKAAPDAEELLSYHMPAYKFHGMLAYFAAHTNHIGLYAMPSAVEEFSKDLAGYKTTKGSVHFPIGQALPLKLIERMIRFRAKANLEKAEWKKKNRKKSVGL